MKYGKLTLGEIEALVNNVGGLKSAREIAQGYIRVTHHRVAFPVWMKLEVGKHSSEALINFDTNRSVTNDDARRLIRSSEFTVFSGKEVIRLARITKNDLSYQLPPETLEQFLAAIANKCRGFFCPPEVGPYLRRQYKGQKKDEKLIVLTRPIMNLSGRQEVFLLERKEDGLFLGTIPLEFNQLWDSGAEFVFSLDQW